MLLLAFIVNETSILLNNRLLLAIVNGWRNRPVAVGLLWDLSLLGSVLNLLRVYGPRASTALRAYQLYYNLFWGLDRHLGRFIASRASWSVLCLATLFPSAMLVTSFISAVVLLTAFLVMMHELLWPVLSKPIYALSDWDLFRNQGRQVVVGVALLTYALHDVLLKLSGDAIK